MEPVTYPTTEEGWKALSGPQQIVLALRLLGEIRRAGAAHGLQGLPKDSRFAAIGGMAAREYEIGYFVGAAARRRRTEQK